MYAAFIPLFFSAIIHFEISNSLWSVILLLQQGFVSYLLIKHKPIKFQKKYKQNFYAKHWLSYPCFSILKKQLSEYVFSNNIFFKINYIYYRKNLLNRILKCPSAISASTISRPKCKSKMTR